MRRKKDIKGNVAFVGLGYAGKTTILEKLKTDNFNDATIRTMGLNVDSFEFNGVNFNTFDLGGQDTFRLIWPPYVSKTIAICYVIDSSTPELFDESAQVLREVLQYAPENGILLILANKSDLAGPKSLQEIINSFDFLNLQETAKLSRINIFYISAKSGDQFNDAFDWLTDSIKDYLKNADKMSKLAESKEKKMDELKNSLGTLNT